MKCQILNDEKNMVTIEMTVSAQDFNVAIKKVYLKERSKFNVQGFRKGKAPQKMIELHYGKEVFYDGAIDLVLPDTYTKALDELKVEPVSKPEVEIKKVGGDDGLVVTATFATKPEINIEGYKGVEVDAVKTVISDEEVDAELKKQQELNGRLITVEDRAVENGDIAVIDYEGFVDDVPFEGGKDFEHELEIGSGSFIPGFEEQLIGKNVDDDVDVKVTFPEQYHAEELAGKEAVFKVKILEIKTKELPELDDEFAKDTSEFDTLDELKADIRTNLETAAKKRDDAQLQNNIIDEVLKLVEVDIPTPMVEMEIDGMVDDLTNQLRYQGLDMEQYLQYSGTTLEQLRESTREDATQRVKASLMLEAVIEKEKIIVTDEDMDEEFERIAEAQKRSVEELKKLLVPQMDYIKSTIKTKKAVDVLVSNAKIK